MGGSSQAESAFPYLIGNKKIFFFRFFFSMIPASADSFRESEIEIQWHMNTTYLPYQFLPTPTADADVSRFLPLTHGPSVFEPKRSSQQLHHAVAV